MNYYREHYPREYRIWKAMRSRCNAPCLSNTSYQRKGIKVCPEWDSFETFILDMGPCPPGYSIDRIDNDGNYCKENCRWASSYTQTANRGNFNRTYSVLDKKDCLKQIARDWDIKYSTLYARYRRHPELSIEELLSFSDKRQEAILWKGEYYTRQELCSLYNIPAQTFYDRSSRGWPLEKILLQKKRKSPIKK